MTATDQWQTGFKVHLSALTTELRNVSFFYHKKQGLFKLKDSGIADIAIAGTGLDILLEAYSTTPYERESLNYGPLKTSNVRVKIDK